MDLVLDKTPPILRPKLEYPNLSGHKFTGDEKKLICEEIDGVSDTLERTNSMPDGTGYRSVGGIAARYHISFMMIQHWLERNFRKGIPFPGETSTSSVAMTSPAPSVSTSSSSSLVAAANPIINMQATPRSVIIVKVYATLF